MNRTLRFSAIANLRVVAIVAIILNHAQIGISANTEYSTGYLLYSQFFKFGSLLFMIIGGFLFQNSVNKYSYAELIRRKALTILIPTLIFIFPWIVLNLLVLPQLGEKKQAIDLQFAGKELFNLFFRSIYWFPINLFLILLLNNYIRSIKLVKFLLVPAILITLFYSINIYFHWIPRKHNSAILAYFSFFFLGRLLFIYFQPIKHFLGYLKSSLMLRLSTTFATLSAFGLSVYESYSIQEANLRTDPGNILRFSNIIYTFLLLVLLFNYRERIKTGNYFKEKTVFLIYLVHPYWLYIGKHVSSLIYQQPSLHTAKIIPLEILYAILLLLFSLGVSRLLLSKEIFNLIINGEISAVYFRTSRYLGKRLKFARA
ncbi:acyltransferase family protein [Desertivirga brevis]|uniref:acyltransferase family protein n=1 Tax=Desertivirga brevis TaxID=2810310 RepID=UPI001A966BC1|nr:acyltransferase [Pedobacter sp. SYSU D00873]